MIHCTTHPNLICKTMKHYPSTRSVFEPIGYSSLDISENMLNNNHMNMFWLIHELVEGIHCITNVWSGMYSIYQGPNDLTIYGGVFWI
jgi:hypothetical protein